MDFDQFLEAFYISIYQALYRRKLLTELELEELLRMERMCEKD